MSKEFTRGCQVCGKRASRGNLIERRGLAKKAGGVGRKVTGITARSFRPNLQNIRIRSKGRVIRARVCAACIKAGKVQKAG